MEEQTQGSTPDGSGGYPPPAGYQPVPPYPTKRPYPLTFNVDYPDRQLNRLSSALRFLWIIPIGIIVCLLSWGGSQDHGNWAWGTTAVLFFPTVLMLLFRQKYPRWWFDWNLSLSRFLARVCVYAALLRDEYPSTDEEQAVHLDFSYPDATQLSRGLPLVKWFLAIPHYIVLYFLWIGAIFSVVFAWFAILLTGRYPRPLFDYVVGVMRWGYRVEAYAFLLITDEYPPFSLQ